MSKQSKFRVAICGAGIGGLALAVTIGKYGDLLVDLYEAGPQVSTVGAGISVWKRTWEIMQQLGLDADLAKKAISPPKEADGPGPVYRRSDQPEEGYDFFRQMLPYGAITLHRADLVDILKQSLPQSCTLHFSKRLTKYTGGVSGPVNLYFSDGTVSETDVLIGTDGVRSATRAILFESLAEEQHPDNIDVYNRYIHPTWSGTIAYRCLIPTENLKAICPDHKSISETIFYCGKNKHIVSYPVSQGRLINFVAFYTVDDGEGTPFEEKWVMDVPAQEVCERYVGWEPLVQDLLKCVNEPSRWAIHVLDALPLYVSKRVALLGDAAHAMTTHFGAGAGQAIEDAFILGRLLTHDLTLLDNIEEVLRIFEEIRLPFANNVVREARLTGLMYEFNAHGLYDGIDRSHEKDGLDELKRAIEEQWAWQAQGGSDEDWKRAEKRLKKVLTIRCRKL